MKKKNDCSYSVQKHKCEKYLQIFLQTNCGRQNFPKQTGLLNKQIKSFFVRWPEPIYMRVGYVFDLRCSEWKIQPISMIFGILNK